jgi:stress response protein SCP2
MEVSSIEVDVTIVQGRDLVAKDKNFLGNKTTSDPYIKVYHDGHKQYETQCVEKSLDPQWNESMKIHTKKIKGESSIVFRIFDRDLMSDDDNMGTVTIPLPDFTQTSSAPPPSTKWYAVEKGEEGDPYYCKKAKGEVQISLAVSVRKLLSIKRGNSKSFFGTIQLQLNWDLEAQSTDLDTSCVAIDGYGKILMDETVYFGDLVNSNGSITHSGDSLTGGRGKGEVITCKLDRIKRHVKALYFILSVATPGRTFEAVESSEVLVRDVDAGMDVCRFTPTFHGKNTSMFLMRLARIGGSWKLTVIEDTDHTGKSVELVMKQSNIMHATIDD